MREKLPEDWKLETVHSLAEVNPRRERKKVKLATEEVSFIPMEAVDEINGTLKPIQNKVFHEQPSSYTYFENGDIIFAKITPCMENGKCAIVNGLKNGFGYGSSEFIVLKPKNEIIGRWVYYFLRTKEFRKAAEDNFTGSAGQQRVPADFVKNYLLPFTENLTELESQLQKIQSRLAHIEHMRRAAEQQLEAVEAMPAAVLREAFSFE